MSEFMITFKVANDDAKFIWNECYAGLKYDYEKENGYIYFTCNHNLFDVIRETILYPNKIETTYWIEDKKELLYNNISDFEQIVTELIDIQKSKNTDYGDSFSRNIDKYGLIAGLIPIANKFHRLEQLITTGNQQVKSESIEDTLKDLACYSIMMLGEVRKK